MGTHQRKHEQVSFPLLCLQLLGHHPENFSGFILRHIQVSAPPATQKFDCCRLIFQSFSLEFSMTNLHLFPLTQKGKPSVQTVLFPFTDVHIICSTNTPPRNFIRWDFI